MLQLLPCRFNEEYNLFMAHGFMSGSGMVPWVDCYVYNFNTTLEWLWMFAGIIKPKQVRD